ncbi:PAS domain-containing protein [Neoasaia chiangmaiensis NBRC 101099]|uniref:Diguanylate cyclase n=1 Tax=Neoasaia chiangmaiensis TaxID=320497 RepID=A0A1U9KSC0_9PROT|nr:EAL domain-containing protein [Neoasaia chiangmaiensis]AQS88675.1 hypothetical protein A0U93_12935 [Neoasaia chiangmaiensis]GBR41082.1 PAS domain-containing protein [Neoasaia chiangmaiensis NBRC 101099]
MGRHANGAQPTVSLHDRIGWQSTADGRLARISDALCVLLGQDRATLAKKTMRQALVPPSEWRPWRTGIGAMLGQRRPIVDHLHSIEIDGVPRWLNISAMPAFDAEGRYRGYRGTIADVTDRVLTPGQIEQSALRDRLTGLPLHAEFVSRLTQRCEAARAQAEPGIALVLIHFRRLQAINTELGHATGDILIGELVERMQGAFTGCDTGRLGSGRFGVIVPLSSSEDTSQLLIRIAHAKRIIEAPSKLLGIRLTTLTDIGIATFPAQAGVSGDLLRRADLALAYAQKEMGRLPCLFHPDMEAESRQHIRMGWELEQSIANDALLVVYQAIFDVRSGKAAFVEALVRWPHPVHGTLGGGDIIAAAESTGYTDALGLYVLRRACREVIGLPYAIDLSVNVSPSQFDAGDLPEKIAEILADTGFPGNRLIVEITENICLRVSADTQDQLRRLRDLGVRLFLDDFGVGFSSLIYLNQFDVDGLKIDGSFVQSLLDRGKAKAIVSAIARLAHDLDLSLTIEKVENEAQSRWLADHGIVWQQGYHLGRPCPIAMLPNVLDAGYPPNTPD